jgi:hypothetical protein
MLAFAKIRKSKFACGFVWVIYSFYDVKVRTIAHCLKTRRRGEYWAEEE